MAATSHLPISMVKINFPFTNLYKNFFVMAKKKKLCRWKQAIYFPVYPAVNRGQIWINSIVSAKNTYTPKTHCWWSALNLSEIECRKKHQVISACQSGLSGISIMPSVTGDFRLESSKSVTGDSKFKSSWPLLSSAHQAASKSLSVFRRFRWSYIVNLQLHKKGREGGRKGGREEGK